MTLIHKLERSLMMDFLILSSFFVGSLILYVTSRPCAELLGRINGALIYGLIGIQTLCLLSYVGFAAYTSLRIVSKHELLDIPSYVLALAFCVAFGLGSIRKSLEVKQRVASMEV